MGTEKSIASQSSPSKLAPTLFAGLLLAILNVVFMISFAALLIPKELAAFLPSVIGSLILGSAVVALVVGLRSSIEGMIATVQDVPIAVMALAVANISQRLLQQGFSEEQAFYSVIAAIIMAALVTGFLFILLGRFRLGGFVRYLPYPVVGGFLAGSGWLLFKGGLDYIAGTSLSLDTLGDILSGNQTSNVLIGSVFAIAMLLASRRIKHTLFLPAFLAAGFLLFYLILPITGTSIQDALGQGVLLGPFPSDVSYEFLTASALAQADWPSILGEIASLAAIFGISAIALLLNTSGMELEMEREIDLNVELQAAGWGSLASGVVGSSIAFHTLVDTLLGHRMGAKSRWLGAVVAGSTMVLLFAGASFIQFLPKVVVGGLLIFLGLSFLVDWLYESWFRLPKDEYVVIALIVLVIASFGFLQGVTLGVLAAVAIFAVNYANINPVENVLSGKEFRSSVQYSQEESEFLDEVGESVHILRLQGYVFFGTANRLLEHTRERLAETMLPELRFLLFDFGDVAKLDSTAAVSFNKIENLAKEFDFQVVLTDLSNEMLGQLENGGYGETFGTISHQYQNIDFGLEYCEHELIRTEFTANKKGETNWFPTELANILPRTITPKNFLKSLERVEFSKGDILIASGMDEDVAYLIEEGRVDFLVESEDGEQHRLESVGAGMILGEEQLYEEMLSVFSMVAQAKTVAYKISEEALEKMGTESPELRVAFDQYIIGVLAKKLNRSRKMSESLLQKS